MSELMYRVVLEGTVATGRDRPQVIAELARLFKCNAAQAEGLLNGTPQRLKKTMPHAKAQAYVARLLEAGVAARMEAATPPVLSPDTARPAAAPPVLGADRVPPAAAARATPAQTPSPPRKPLQVDDTALPEEHASLTFEFTGRAGEYFRIWIVNIVLTVLTLGIYHAWAKVRNNRYFYGNTRLAGSSFEYRGEPIPILKGWLIAAGFLLLWQGSGFISPVLAAVFILIFVVAFPWLVVKAMMFRMRNSVYRNIAFQFRPNYKEAITVFIGLFLLTIVTLGLAYFYLQYRRSRFLVENTAYGATPFRLDASARDFFGLYAKFSLVMLLLGAVAVTIIGGLIGFGFSNGETPNPSTAPLLAMVVPLVLVPMYLIAYSYLAAATANLIWSTTRLGDHQFESTLSVVKMAWLYLSNTAAIIVSLGLLAPWTKIRLTRYRLENLTLHVSGNLDRFVAAQGEDANAFADGMSDVFDIDIGL